MLIQSIEKLAKKMQRGYFKKPQQPSTEKEISEDYSVADRKRGSRRPMLTPTEKLDVVHQIVVQHKMVREVAKEHRITSMHANVLVMKAKKKPRLIAEIFNKEIASAQKRERIEMVVNNMVQNDEFIDSCKAVLTKVNSEMSTNAMGVMRSNTTGIG